MGSIIIASLPLSNLSLFLLQLGQLQDGAEEDTARQCSGGSGLSWPEQEQPQHVVHHATKLRLQDPSISQVPQLHFHVLGMHFLDEQKY